MRYHGRFEQQKQPKNTGKKGNKGLKIFLIVLAVLLVLILIAAAVGYWFIQDKFSKMNVITLPEDTYVYTEATDEYTRPPETETVQAETTEETTEQTTRPDSGLATLPIVDTFLGGLLAIRVCTSSNSV